MSKLLAVRHAIGKAIRFIKGGTWVKMDGVWHRVTTLMLCKDGSKIFMYHDADYVYTSFHQSHESITETESYR